MSLKNIDNQTVEPHRWISEALHAGRICNLGISQDWGMRVLGEANSGV
jgi:hypothetical protein